MTLSARLLSAVSRVARSSLAPTTSRCGAKARAAARISPAVWPRRMVAVTRAPDAAKRWLASVTKRSAAAHSAASLPTRAPRL